MAEYIEKQAAIEALDEQIALCDKALKSFGISMKDEYAVKVERASLITYKEQLETIPATDVVPGRRKEGVRSMGKKYVVEIGRLERLYKAYINGNGKPNITWLSPEVDLTPYTEPDLEQARKEAYQKGYETGYEDGYNEPGKNQQEAYQRGLNDAWDAARKIVLGDINIIVSVFDTVSRSIIIRDLTATEAIEKIRQYEQEQEEIKVGDEVQFKNTGSKFVVTRIFASEEGRKCEGLFDDGEVYESVLDGGNVEKTGRTFPEIATVLEKMRGEQDG